jgi:hypothetical protein
MVFLAALAIWPMGSWGQNAAPAEIVFENAYLRYAVAADGRNLAWVDKATGTDYCQRDKAPVIARVKKAGQVYDANNASFDQGKLSLEFGAASVRAEMRVESFDHYVTFEVAAVDGEGVEELTFLDLALNLEGKPEEAFAGCALALNLQTNVPEVPGPNQRLRALCYPRFGLEGAKVALLGCPMAALRDTMKEVVRASKDLPQSDIGGPWALDAEISYGSYLFDFGQVTEATVDDWVAFVKKLGLNQIDFHTGSSLRFGDCYPNPELFPRGRDSVKAVIDKLHAGGISAGLHTYAFFIDKKTPYVTPVPDPRLGKMATFTLAEAINAEADSVTVLESTQNVSTLTAFFARNSVTLQIDDELITFSAASKEPPYTFTGCKRGACGTQPASHVVGAKVYQLKECFGLFAPDADSTLLTEVAENTANTFNECGFDMIYLDALDGEDILAGAENAWHYGSKFVFEIAHRLKKPALFEMSTFHHHLWYVRARMGAWDHPARSHKRFVDVHCAANYAGRGMFLPMNLGWWAVKTWEEGLNSIQIEPTFPDDIEYLLGKCLGYNYSLSLMGVNPGNIGSIPAYQRLAPMFQQYEDLRHAKYFSEDIKARLRAPGEEFTLEAAGEGAWRFRPAQYDQHKVTGIDGAGNQWTANNRFGPQPARLRIEALMSVGAYDAPESVLIEDFSQPESFTVRTAESGVQTSLAASTDQVKTGTSSGYFAASSERAAPGGAWAQIGKTLAPTLNIAATPALGVWVYGDGKGELLNLQLKSSHQKATGGIGDHYVPVDFTGWRYFELVEMEGGRIAEYAWPYGGNAYGIYRENVDFNAVETFSLWYNNVPAGGEAGCYLGAVKGLPLVKGTLRKPAVTIAGRTVVFPVEITSGSYLEYAGKDDCTLYGPKGEVLAEVKPEGDTPELASGANDVAFTCETEPAVSARARVTVISRGEPL